MDSVMVPPGIDSISELFDCGVITEAGQHPVTKTDCGVYALGEHSEPSAGLHGFTLTPFFYSKKQLEKYCRSKKGRSEINIKATEIFPDWNGESASWKEVT